MGAETIKGLEALVGLSEAAWAAVISTATAALSEGGGGNEDARLFGTSTSPNLPTSHHITSNAMMVSSNTSSTHAPRRLVCVCQPSSLATNSFALDSFRLVVVLAPNTQSFGGVGVVTVCAVCAVCNAGVATEWCVREREYGAPLPLRRGWWCTCEG